MTQYEPINFLLKPGDGREIKFGMDYERKVPILDCWHKDRSIPCGTMGDVEVGNVMIRVVQPGDSVIDAGANLGFFSMFMSQLVGPSGKVLAIEPDPNVRSNMELSLKQNKIENVAVCDYVLWNEPDCSINFNVYTGWNGYSSVVLYSGAYDGRDLKCEPRQCTTTTLDTLTQIQKNIRCLKIDCEGAELPILYGAEQLLRRGVDAIILELNPTLMNALGYDIQRVRDYMTGFGYDMFLLSKNGFLPILVPTKTELVQPPPDKCYFNVLFSTVDKVAQYWPAISL